MEKEGFVGNLVAIGTVPVEEPSVIKGYSKIRGESLEIDGFSIEISPGTQTMIAAATVACEAIGVRAPYAVVAGDIGGGKGSDALFVFLLERACELSPRVIVWHYIYPSFVMKDVFETIKEECEPRPVLIADAGSMYNVVELGLAKEFDLLTPDPGEMGYLGDPDAAHPVYVSNPIFEIDTEDVPKLVSQAYQHGKASKVLLIKGPTDFIVKEGKVVQTIREPNIPALEAIGGTGDTITGIVSALIYGGYNVVDAATYAAKANRLAGSLANPTPATPISEIIPHIPVALRKILGK
ncbi:MAG: NAD(P)H-hydrate dehydratase [Candidatus Bathyarchaeia archaeon]